MVRNPKQLEALINGLEQYRKYGTRILYQIPTDQRILVNNYLEEIGEINQ